MRKWITKRVAEWGNLPVDQQITVDAGELQKLLQTAERHMALVEKMRRVKGLSANEMVTMNQMFGPTSVQ